MEEIKNFYLALAKSEAFKAKLEKFRQENGDNFGKIIEKLILPEAKKMGYSFTKEDLLSYEKANKSDSLSDEDLLAITGGFGVSPHIVAFTLGTIMTLSAAGSAVSSFIGSSKTSQESSSAAPETSYTQVMDDKDDTNFEENQLINQEKSDDLNQITNETDELKTADSETQQEIEKQDNLNKLDNSENTSDTQKLSNDEFLDVLKMLKENNQDKKETKKEEKQSDNFDLSIFEDQKGNKNNDNDDYELIDKFLEEQNQDNQAETKNNQNENEEENLIIFDDQNDINESKEENQSDNFDLSIFDDQNENKNDDNDDYELIDKFLEKENQDNQTETQNNQNEQKEDDSEIDQDILAFKNKVDEKFASIHDNFFNNYLKVAKDQYGDQKNLNDKSFEQIANHYVRIKAVSLSAQDIFKEKCHNYYNAASEKISFDSNELEALQTAFENAAQTSYDEVVELATRYLNKIEKAGENTSVIISGLKNAIDQTKNDLSLEFNEAIKYYQNEIQKNENIDQNENQAVRPAHGINASDLQNVKLKKVNQNNETMDNEEQTNVNNNVKTNKNFLENLAKAQANKENVRKNYEKQREDQEKEESGRQEDKLKQEMVERQKSGKSSAPNFLDELKKFNKEGKKLKEVKNTNSAENLSEHFSKDFTTDKRLGKTENIAHRTFRIVDDLSKLSEDECEKYLVDINEKCTNKYSEGVEVHPVAMSLHFLMEYMNGRSSSLPDKLQQIFMNENEGIIDQLKNNGVKAQLGEKIKNIYNSKIKNTLSGIDKQRVRAILDGFYSEDGYENYDEDDNIIYDDEDENDDWDV